MRPALLILLVSWVYVGCSTERRPAGPGSDPRNGGVVRLLPADAFQARAIRFAAVAGSLAPPGLLVEESEPPLKSECAAFRVREGARFADGARVGAQSVIDVWEQRLRRDPGAVAWLLSPVLGADDLRRGAARHASGLRATARDRLLICSDRSVADWPLRLSHPDLWLLRHEDDTGRPVGAGAFEAIEAGSALARTVAAGRAAPSVDRVEFVGAGEIDPGLMFERDAVDLALVSSRAAGALLDAPESPVRLTRAPLWDTVYALRLSDRARWVNDPRFRAWLASAIDRPAMLRFLFDGRGEPAFRLSGAGGAEWSVPDSRPFAASSSPRLRLSYSPEDAHAVSIASRLKAGLEQQGLEILLEPIGAGGLRQALDAGDLQMALVAHRPPVEDPVLALLHTLWNAGLSRDAAWELLEQASWWPPGESRRSAAVYAEDTLLRDARVVPLVRLSVWLAADPELDGVSVGPWGILTLDRARWKR